VLQSKIHDESARRGKAVCPILSLLQDDIVPNFQITSFLALRRRNLVDLDPMTH
jgi:hypothetical protein